MPKKTRIYFDCGDSEVFVETLPCDEPVPTDPSHLEVLRLPVELPENPLFAPAVNVRVYDGGSVVGSSSIPLAGYLPWSGLDRPKESTVEHFEGDIPGAAVCSSSFSFPSIHMCVFFVVYFWE